MPLALLRRQCLNQPNGDGIDWSNPLTAGLVGLLDAASGTDRVTGGKYNLVGRNVSKSGGGYGTTAGTPTSNGMYSNRIDTDPNTNWRPVSPIMTLAVAFDYYGHGSGASLLSAGFGAGGNCFAIYTNFSDGTLVALISDGTSHVNYGAAGNLVIGSSNVAVMTYDGVNLRSFLNGKQIASSAQTIGNLTAYNASFTRTCLIGAPGVIGAAANGHLGGLWNRALSDAEIKTLSANPWQVFL